MPAEAQRYLESDYILKAQERGVEFEQRPSRMVVITGYSAVTGFGGTKETLDGIWAGESPVRTTHRLKGFDTRLLSPLPRDFDPIQLLRESDDKLGQSKFSASCVVLGREALGMAGLLNENGKLDTEKVHPYQVASWVSSGYAATDQMIEVHKRIHPGSEDRVTPDLSLQLFPEQGNGRLSQAVGLKGPGGNTMEACATGASNIIEAFLRVKHGEAKVAVAGGIETVVDTHPAEALSAFIALKRAMSKRNEDPKGASRPFNVGRDGFVPGSGGAVVILEDLDHALARGAKIYARIIGVGKSMDAFKPTELDPYRAADTIGPTLYDPIVKQIRIPDAFFMHATSTDIGDLNEVIAHWIVFQKELEGIPAAAIKSEIGHVLGGAGSLNAVAAIHALQPEVQSIPVIRNLNEPDQRIMDKGLAPVRDDIYIAPPHRPLHTILAGANGFGGYNAYLFIGDYQEISMAAA